MTALPFICLGIGIILGLTIKARGFQEITDKVSDIALISMMLCIGTGIGTDENIIREFPRIGFNCIIIALSAIAFSVLFTVICEKTVLPLKKLEQELSSDKSGRPAIEEGKISNLVWIMPVSLIIGLMAGFFLRNHIPQIFIDKAFTVALIILYICVGISQGSNKEVFHYLRVLGLRVLWIPAAVLCGSLVGGFVPALFLHVPMKISVISAGGMSFYSITGAYMTQTYGLTFGTYGFIVNVLREFFTVLIMPLLIKISRGSPIAGGAAGDMDTMLAPITKFVGSGLSLVTLLTGMILTFIVPILLPVLTEVLG